ncbi:MAG: ArsR/SmtB family transcription factor [Planctomycetota bacterium]
MQDLVRLLGAPRRQELVRLCWDQEQSAGDLHRALPDVTFGAVSQQLGKLVAAGALAVRRSGRHRFYRARPEALGPLRQLLETMWADALWQLKLRAELAAGRRGPRRRARPRRRTPKSPTPPPQSRP